MPIRRVLSCLPVSAAMLLAACGGGEKVEAGTYTCGEFKQSLETKDDRTAGTYIRLLNDRAKLKGSRSDQEKRMAYAIYVACRGAKASFTPADAAVENAKQLAAGKRVIPVDIAERERKAAERAAAEAKKKPAE